MPPTLIAHLEQVVVLDDPDMLAVEVMVGELVTALGLKRENSTEDVEFGNGAFSGGASRQLAWCTRKRTATTTNLTCCLRCRGVGERQQNAAHQRRGHATATPRKRRHVVSGAL